MKYFAGVFATLFIATNVQAAPEVAFQINQSVYNFSMSSTKNKPKEGDETSASTNSVTTMPSDLELFIGVGSTYFYVYPTQPGAAFGLGYQVTDALELGIGLSYDMPNKDNNSLGASVYGFYPLSLSDSCSLEFEAGLSYGMSKETAAAESDDGDAEASASTKYSSMGGYASATYIHNLAGGVSYFGGASFSMTSTKDSDDNMTTTDMVTTLTLLGLRVDF